MELKDYTTEELRAEIKRRYELAQEAKKQEPRCRNCEHLMNHPQVRGMYLWSKNLGQEIPKTLLCKVGKKVISYREWLTPDQALRAVEIARGEMMDKACEWLKENLWKVANDLTDKEDKNRFIKEFCKAMEE